MTRVLHVVQSGDRGGVQRHVHDLATGLGHATAGVITGTSGWLTGALEEAGVAVLRAPHLRRSFDPLRAPAARRDVREAWRQAAPDVVHAHGVLALLACLPLAGETPLVYTSHGFQWRDASHPAWIRLASQRLHRIAGPRAAAFVALGSEAEEARSLGFRRVAKIPHGVAPIRCPGGTYATASIGTAARLVAGKGVEQLLEVLARLPQATLRIAGDGPMRAKLAEEAARLGVRGRVEFLGWQADLSDFYRGISVYASLSQKEGLPYGVLDALAAGLPVVLSDIPGHRELVRHEENGFLVPLGEVPAAAQAIGRLLTDERLRVEAQAASREAAGTYDLTSMLGRYAELYGEVSRS